MEFGNTEFDWDLDSLDFWDFSPQSLKLLEDSLLAEVFSCEDTSEHFEHNHIQTEHDYFKRNFCEDMTTEEDTEQNDCSSLKSLLKPKKQTSEYKTSSKRNKTKCDYGISHLSKSEQKSFKKCLRKMKNRVRMKRFLLSFPSYFNISGVCTRE